MELVSNAQINVQLVMIVTLVKLVLPTLFKKVLHVAKPVSIVQHAYILHQEFVPLVPTNISLKLKRIIQRDLAKHVALMQNAPLARM